MADVYLLLSDRATRDGNRAVPHAAHTRAAYGNGVRPVQASDLLFVDINDYCFVINLLHAVPADFIRRRSRMAADKVRRYNCRVVSVGYKRRVNNPLGWLCHSRKMK